MLQAPMHRFRPLTQADLPALLDFERENRAHFEQWVPPRPDWFFADPARYTAHMKTLLNEHRSGSFLMYVMEDTSGQILGRVNLTTSPTPSLGYRIAKAHAGKGLASAAVHQICTIARQTHAMSELTAQAARSNPASQRVLTKNGFTKTQAPAHEATLNGQPIWLEHFHKRL